MGNALKMDKKAILAGLFRLGWSDRAINKETGIHRVTAKRYRAEFQSVPKVPTDISSAGSPLPQTNSPALLPYRDFIRDELNIGLTAQRIYQERGNQNSDGDLFDRQARGRPRVAPTDSTINFSLVRVFST